MHIRIPWGASENTYAWAPPPTKILAMGPGNILVYTYRYGGRERERPVYIYFIFSGDFHVQPELRISHCPGAFIGLHWNPFSIQTIFMARLWAPWGKGYHAAFFLLHPQHLAQCVLHCRFSKIILTERIKPTGAPKTKGFVPTATSSPFHPTGLDSRKLSPGFLKSCAWDFIEAAYFYNLLYFLKTCLNIFYKRR